MRADSIDRCSDDGDNGSHDSTYVHEEENELESDEGLEKELVDEEKFARAASFEVGFFLAIIICLLRCVRHLYTNLDYARLASPKASF
jgi:hypothetical protein